MVGPYDPNDPEDPYNLLDRTKPKPGSTAPDPYLNTTPEDSTPRVIPEPTTPPGAQTPTRKLPPAERPPAPLPGMIWNDDWWDGKSDYVGGWLYGNTDPRTDPGIPHNGGTSGGGGKGMGGFDYNSFDWPGFESAGKFSPRHPDFNYENFKGSSWADAENEPGFKGSRDLLKRQLEAGAAFKGIARSGMALGDIYTNLDALNGQNFKQFDDRNYRNWGANRDLAQLKWMDEYQVDKDTFDFGARDVDRANNYRFNVAKTKFDANLQSWLEQIRSLTSITSAGLNG